MTSEDAGTDVDENDDKDSLLLTLIFQRSMEFGFRLA